MKTITLYMPYKPTLYITINPILWILSILLICAFPFTSRAEETPVTVIDGIVINSQNKKPLANVSLTIVGSNVSTVTNSEGKFSLKVSPDDLNKDIKAELIGFKTAVVRSDFNSSGDDGRIVIRMEPGQKISPIEKMLAEVTVYGGEPRKIVEEALRKIPENYPQDDNLLTGFYRETIQKGNRFISISEATVDVLKKSYKHRTSRGDKVKINKARSLASQKSSDTLAVKLAGGPYMPVMLDIVKNGDHLFHADEMDYFNFIMEEPVMIDDRMHFAVRFLPKVKLSYPLNKGRLFIDGETLAISRAEFELDMSDRNKATRAILQKKPSGLHFSPREVSGIVTYKFIDGKSYLNYISSTIKFKCDWKKRLFSSGYTTKAEMVITDRKNETDNSRFKDSFSQRKIFSDMVENYWEEDFWKDYNIIEPTESLEKAVVKLKKK